ncbi:rRNA maturation RNase YbeY [Cellulophaga sp. Hel_I_12]|uniref:rRNA maturation RNase YbeY n=1 Tax=Cellulophaga sp. Hel_I_12 TaxID=1249972 RepID=UPI0006460391|nr:rRNA maturation RNase YbeY [Cellulophaga sp. Hel_I_12]
MIEFNYEIDFEISNEVYYTDWITRVILSEKFEVGPLSFVFCSDEYLIDINIQYLNHETYTDIITFDYCEGNRVSGDIFISSERVEENARKYEVGFEEELLRVMAHGLLHLMKYKDKSVKDSEEMRLKEDEKIKLFHVEH